MENEKTRAPRQAIVAVTGHRPNRLRIAESAAQTACLALLSALRIGLSGRIDGAPIALSALAEGADTAFARAALEAGWRLRALLPMPRAVYARTLDAPDAADALDALLAQAENVEEMPGDPDDGASPYAALMFELLERADAFIAIWDGGASAGAGGTTDLIERAVRRGQACVWIDATGEKTAPRIIAPFADPFDTAAHALATPKAMVELGRRLALRED